MKTLLSILVLVALGAVPVYADDLAELTNPLADAMVGEWAKYQASFSNPLMGGEAQPVSVTTSVVAVNGTNVDVKSALDFMGMPQESVQTIDTAKSITEALAASASGPLGQMGNMKIVSSSVESVDYEHNGTTYAAKKIVLSIEGEVTMGGGPGTPVTSTATVIMAYEIPVQGILKAEITTEFKLGDQPMTVTFSQSLLESGTEGLDG